METVLEPAHFSKISVWRVGRQLDSTVQFLELQFSQKSSRERILIAVNVAAFCRTLLSFDELTTVELTHLADGHWWARVACGPGEWLSVSSETSYYAFFVELSNRLRIGVCELEARGSEIAIMQQWLAGKSSLTSAQTARNLTVLLARYRPDLLKKAVSDFREQFGRQGLAFEAEAHLRRLKAIEARS